MTALIKYEAARHALAEAKAVDEVKDLRDKADAMRIYAMQAKNKSLEVDAAEIRIRAERRLGEMIAAQKEAIGMNQGTRGQLQGRSESGESLAVDTNDRQKIPTLSDAGISKDLSSRSQKLAAVPEDEFEAEVADWRERVQEEGRRVTTRLEQAGDRAQAKLPASPSQEKSADQAIIDELRDVISNLEDANRALEELNKDIEAENKALLTAVDPEVHALVQKTQAYAAQLEQRRDDLMASEAKLMSELKKAGRQIDRLEKELAALKQGGGNA
ncbi:hypothetical protein ACMHYJ_05340 [Castellaniella hirudinis]|uniref:hypothetical protein n=1 Tax=Castellaniella hirudinis TaxID=1144617 RepID=UPI0039C0E6D9